MKFYLDFYILEDSSDLENLLLVNIFFHFCFLDALLRLHFSLDVSIFTKTDKKKERTISSSTIFEG